MKKVFVVCFLLLFAVQANAKKEKVFFDGSYARNSISFLVVNHNDRYDDLVNAAVDDYIEGKFDFITANDKFDYNDLDIKTIEVNYPRQINSANSEVSSPKVPYTTEEVQTWISDLNLGKEIISFWFSRTSDGKMNEQRVLERGRLNATDQDIRNAMATEIGKEMIAEQGYSLISRSYVVVLDAYAIGNYTRHGANVRKVSMFADIYVIDLQEGMLDDIFENGWVYEGDDEASARKKVEFYNQLQIPIKHVRSIDVTVQNADIAFNNLSKSALQQTEYSEIDCVAAAIDKVLSNKKMDEWKVVTPIMKVHPIQAKVGKKESVRNGQKFRAYRIVEDKNGNLSSKKSGQVRAANKIIDNRGIASGNTEPSEFYQISGKTVSPGMLLVEHRDLKMNFGVSAQIGGGGVVNANFSLGYLAWLNTFAGGRFAAYHYGLIDYTTNKIFTVGYGCGLRLIRNIELMPYLKFGIDQNNKFGVDGGLGLNLQVAYPMDICLRVGGNSFVSSLISNGDGSVGEIAEDIAKSLPVYVTFGLRFNL